MTPISLINPKSVTPTFYRMTYRRIKCNHCGLIHSHDEVYAMVAVASGFTRVEIKSMSDVMWNLPVKVDTAALDTTPWCHICWNPDLLKGLPKPDAASQRPVTPSWAGTGINPNSKAAKDAKDAKKPKKKVWTGTVDDLDID